MNPSARDGDNSARSATRRLVMLLRVIVVLLSLQFVLGMWVNLFGPLPSTGNLGVALSYTGDPALTAHIALAVLLVILGIVVVVVAVGGETRVSLRWALLLGSLSILWASAAGVEFVLSGFASSADSFSMALAFILGTSFYGVAQALVLPVSPTGGPPAQEERGRGERDSMSVQSDDPD